MLRYARCNTGLDNLFCDSLDAIAVCFMVAVEYGEVEAIGTVDLDVNVTRAREEFDIRAAANHGMTYLRMLPPRSITRAGRSPRAKNVRCEYVSAENDAEDA